MEQVITYVTIVILVMLLSLCVKFLTSKNLKSFHLNISVKGIDLQFDFFDKH